MDTAYTSDGTATSIRPDLAAKLGLPDSRDDIDHPSEYTRHCGCLDIEYCGHPEGMNADEIGRFHELSWLRLDSRNRLLQWLRDEADAGRHYDGRDGELLEAKAVELDRAATNR